jgi:hypothetical protein
MISNNKLDKSFGPVGTVAGTTLFITGLILTFFSLSGLFLILTGAFVGFSYSSTLIDHDKKRVRFSNNLFGILRIGQWVNIESNMKIGIKRSNKSWRAYSGSNRSVDFSSKDFRIILFDSNNKEILPLKKTDSLYSAKAELELFVNQLGLGRVLFI